MGFRNAFSLPKWKWRIYRFPKPWLLQGVRSKTLVKKLGFPLCFWVSRKPGNSLILYPVYSYGKVYYVKSHWTLQISSFQMMELWRIDKKKAISFAHILHILFLVFTISLFIKSWHHLHTVYDVIDCDIITSSLLHHHYDKTTMHVMLIYKTSEAR